MCAYACNAEVSRYVLQQQQRVPSGAQILQQLRGGFAGECGDRKQRARAAATYREVFQGKGAKSKSRKIVEERDRQRNK